MDNELIKKEELVSNLIGNNLIDVEKARKNFHESALEGDKQHLWLKVTREGFVGNGRVVPELKIRIRDCQRYLINWQTPKPIKMTFSEEIPEGFEERADLIFECNRQLMGISLSKSSFRSYCFYANYLMNKKLEPWDVVTLLRVKTVTNDKGTFPVAIFEMIGLLDEVTERESPPSESTLSAQVQNNKRNPWL